MPPIKILIINPNSSQSMTDGLRAPVESLDYNNTHYTYHTSPSGPPSINSPSDAALSTTAILPSLLPLLPHHHAFLVACYSPHPLIPLLRTHTSKPVLGIFEASISTALHLLPHPGDKFGIVSTGDVWRDVFAEAVRGEEMLGREKSEFVYAGTETCGLDAGELHGGRREVERRVKEAAGRLVKGEQGGKVRVVVLGCAGMVGMEEWVGDVVGEEVRIVDGVRAGVGVLQGLVRCGF